MTTTAPPRRHWRTITIAAICCLTVSVVGPHDSSVGVGVLGFFFAVAACTAASTHWEGTREPSRRRKTAAWAVTVLALTAVMVATPLAHEAVIAARSAEHALPVSAATIDDGIYRATVAPTGTLGYDAKTGTAALVVTFTDTEDAVPLLTASIRTEHGHTITCRSAKRWKSYGADFTISAACADTTADDVRHATSIRVLAAR